VSGREGPEHGHRFRAAALTDEDRRFLAELERERRDRS